MFVILVEIFVGIEIRRVGRQAEECDFLLMLFDPLPDIFGMVDTEVVQDHVELLLGGLDGLVEEFDEALGIDGLIVKGEVGFTGGGDGTEHVDTKLFGRMFQNGLFADGSVSGQIVG